MPDDAGFEDYLRVKRIDSVAFRQAEPALWNAWKEEFEQLHPNSFTVQKLNLINPIRRKYQLSDLATPKPADVPKPAEATKSQSVQPPRSGPARPVIKPRPKMN